MMMLKQAKSLTAGMRLDTDAGPAEIVNVARSRGGVFSARDQVIVTYVVRGIEMLAVFTPGQRIGVVR
jgi:hypothetical protein